MSPRAWLVSELTTQEALDDNEKYRTSNFRYVQFDQLIEAVGNALRDVKIHRRSSNMALVYREGDTHALGEIGYKDTRVHGSGEMKFYVHARRISNDKYRDSVWQHNMVASKSISNIVKSAATYLVPYTCEEAVTATREIARGLINDHTNRVHTVAREAFKRFTGEVGYGSIMTSKFMDELRGHMFLSPELNEASAAFYAAYDVWKAAADATKSGVCYVGITENSGQQLVDMAIVDIGHPYKTVPFERALAESAPEWIKGRVAVLNMMPPLKYVDGVGLRIDDRVFYVIPEKEEA